MIVDCYDPVNLFELVPTKLRLEMEPELAALDRLLEDEELFVRLKADFSKRRPNSERLGRRSTPVEVILRMLVLRRLYDWSFEATERNVSDSLVLRQFCRLYLEPAPDDTTLIRWAKLLGPETLESLNERAVALAVEHKATRGRKLRTDATVVEANIPYPRDSALLSDGVRVLSRLVGKAKGILEGTGESFRNRSRSAKQLARRIDEGARRRGEGVKEALKDAYERLIGVAKASLKQAGKVRQMLPSEEAAWIGRRARTLRRISRAGSRPERAPGAQRPERTSSREASEHLRAAHEHYPPGQGGQGDRVRAQGVAGGDRRRHHQRL
jgi:IS5 family transposase